MEQNNGKSIFRNELDALISYRFNFALAESHFESLKIVFLSGVVRQLENLMV